MQGGMQLKFYYELLGQALHQMCVGHPILPGLPRSVARNFIRGDKQQPSFNI